MAVRGMLGVNISNEQWAQMEANVAKEAEPPKKPDEPKKPDTVNSSGTITGGAGAPVIAPAAPFSAQQMLENLLKDAIGVEGLGQWAADLYNRGASSTEIVQSLRYGTDMTDAGKAARAAYLSAFPGMDQFIKDGIFTGASPELQYLAYKNSVKEAASRYGVSDNLVTNEKIKDYISGRNSAAEIINRMSTAAAAVATTPVETLQTLSDYYNVQNGDLISFYLDPVATENELQQRYVAAQIGGQALRQNFGSINVNMAETLANQGVTAANAATGFATAAGRKGFTSGYGELATEEDLINASFGQADSAQKVERIAKSRAGEFAGGGGYISNKTGAAGLGTAAI
jgi:hypothetical protein